MSRYVALLSSFTLLLISVPATANGLPERPHAVIRQQLVPDADVTVVVREVASGDSLVEMNASEPRTPASVMKLLPTFAALDILGPAYTWKTRAFADGPIRNGVLDGNLYLAGGGDPLMMIERWWRFVTDLRQTGLKEIRGNVVVDDSLFAPIDASPGDFDGKPYRTYNVLPDAMLVNLQSSQFTVRPADDRQSIEVAVEPSPTNLVIENRIRAVTGRCIGRRRHFSIYHPPADPRKVIFSGSLSVDCPPQTQWQVVLTPTEYAYGTFRRLWEQQGGSIRGGYARGTTPDGAKQLLSEDSLPLADIIRVTNKYSSNVMARTLLLTLAAEKATKPATVADGKAVIADWLKSKGLDFKELVIGNGSGLSRQARISGDSVARLLRAAWSSRYAPEFLATLPLGGLDGTLRKRFESLADPSRVRMKTGTLDGASSIAGYVTGQSGKTYVVVIMVNAKGAQNGAGEAIQRAVIDWVLDQ